MRSTIGFADLKDTSSPTQKSVFNLLFADEHPLRVTGCACMMRSTGAQSLGNRRIEITFVLKDAGIRSVIDEYMKNQVRIEDP